MNFNIQTIPPFERSVKRILKKYPALKNDLSKLMTLLEQDPFWGQPLGQNCFKIRMTISSNPKWKSGEARVITLEKYEKERLILLDNYDKLEQDSIRDKVLASLIKLADQLF